MNIDKILRNTIGVLLSFAALNAFGGGYYGMAGAEGVPAEWLAGSPFTSYFIPGLVLFVIVGGTFLAAAIAVFTKRSYAHQLTLASVIIVYFWLAVQLWIIGYVSWMQPVTAIVATMILLLTLYERQSVTSRV